ncbi:MAG: hypothetical protein ACXWGU_11150 [Usitatibacter sp.]
MRPPADWDDGDEVLDTDIDAFKALVAQRDSHSQRFRSLKDRLLGRDPA